MPIYEIKNNKEEVDVWSNDNFSYGFYWIVRSNAKKSVVDHEFMKMMIE